MDTTAIVNALVDALIPTLNEELPQAIKDAGLDPWKTVAKGSDTLGKIDLGVCKASAKASYSITDMKGLSSIEITGADVTSLSGTTTITGTLSLSAKLNKDLSARLSGKISAKCGVISDSESISGTATAKGVTGKATGDFTATVGMPQSCLASVKITKFSLDYDDIKVKVDGLGIFNSLLDPLVDAVDALFGDAIKTEVADALRPVLNDLLADELPFCIGVSDVSGALETLQQPAAR
jgi:hypothetical protein